MKGCTVDGSLDDSMFSKPVPWIGLYIASASLLCGIGALSDIIDGFRRRKFWIPSIYFPLNAASLTILGVATKFSVDLNTSMPRHQDQLSKLSSTALLCTFMANVLPSLGSMDALEILSNMVALLILVITIIVNVCIQMGTGVIYVFLPEHAMMLSLTLALLVITSSTALAVPAAKRLLNQQYEKKHNSFLKEEWLDSELQTLQERVRSYWLMARTGNPQHVISRLPTCGACGVLCILITMVLVEAMVRSFISKPMFCSGGSDYGWSSWFVLVAQVIAVLVGTFGVICRSFYAYRVWDGGWHWNEHNFFKTEEHWIQQMTMWKDQTKREYWVHHFPFQIGRWQMIWKFILDSILIVVTKVQAGVVLVSKFIWLATLLPEKWLKEKLTSSTSGNLHNSNHNIFTRDEFILHLEGEASSIRLLQKCVTEDIEQFIQRGRNQKPTTLIELVKRYSNPVGGFKRVADFDSAGVPMITAREIPKSWALSVVTLASIAATLPCIRPESIKFLLTGVDEGLQYIRLIEKNLDERRASLYSRMAADAVWVGIISDRKWFEEDLQSLVEQEPGNEKVLLQKLARIGEARIKKLAIYTGERFDYPNEQHVEDLAANCMHRICETILQNYANICRTDGYLFRWIQTTISDILGACLTNLPRTIEMECSPRYNVDHEESVGGGVSLLWGVEEIMQMYYLHERLYPKNREYLDEWVKASGHP